MAGGPALHTAEMRLPGGAGSSFTYSAHLQSAAHCEAALTSTCAQTLHLTHKPCSMPVSHSLGLHVLGAQASPICTLIKRRGWIQLQLPFLSQTP